MDYKNKYIKYKKKYLEKKSLGGKIKEESRENKNRNLINITNNKEYKIVDNKKTVKSKLECSKKFFEIRKEKDNNNDIEFKKNQIIQMKELLDSEKCSKNTKINIEKLKKKREEEIKNLKKKKKSK